MSAADVDLAASAIRTGAAGRHLVLLTDFDGTLCAFDPDPAAVELLPRRRELLERIGSSGATIAIVSGRRLDDVRSRAALRVPAFYAGLHGLEIAGPGAGGEEAVSYVHPSVARTEALLRELAGPIETGLADIPGTFLEDKGLSMAVHYRAASPEGGEQAEALVMRLAQKHVLSGELRTLNGACMLELLPNIDWDKGSAVQWIVERVARDRGKVWPVYVGDDVTDEDAFRAMSGCGLSITASARAAGADLAVEGPDDVEDLLRRLAL